MKALASILGAVTALAAVMALSGCSDKNPIAPFQPEVINNADAFQFQITAARDVTTTLNYSWVNSGTRATINHATATRKGTATVTIFDANDQQVYAHSLVASATDQSAVGVAGTWRIRILFNDFDGTANFRVEKL
jgi:hypothetical protein